MNNSDLIYRSDVISSFYDGICDMCSEIAAERINAIPAVKQSMSAVEYERVTRRFSDWCASRLCSECGFYDDCPHSSPDVVRELTPEQYVAAMQKWAREHTERSDEDA